MGCSFPHASALATLKARMQRNAIAKIHFIPLQFRSEQHSVWFSRSGTCVSTFAPVRRGLFLAATGKPVFTSGYFHEDTNMHSHVSSAAATRAAQGFLDRLTPPEDPPEAPDMSDDIEALMFGEDTDLVAVDDFKLSAEESMFDMDIRPFDVINLVLAACRSDDMVMRALSVRLRRGLEAHAGTMLDEAHDKAAKEFQRNGEEP